MAYLLRVLPVLETVYLKIRFIANIPQVLSPGLHVGVKIETLLINKNHT